MRTIFISYETFPAMKRQAARVRPMINGAFPGKPPRYSFYDPIERAVFTYFMPNEKVEDEDKQLRQLRFGERFDFHRANIVDDAITGLGRGSFKVEKLSEVYDVAVGGHCRVVEFFDAERIAGLVVDMEHFIHVVGRMQEMMTVATITAVTYPIFKGRDDAEFRRVIIDDEGVARIARNMVRVRFKQLEHIRMETEEFYDKVMKLAKSVLERLQVIHRAIDGHRVVIDPGFEVFKRAAGVDDEYLGKSAFL